jgi:hypothetical protein
MGTISELKRIEWSGGIFSLPAYVADEGEPYRPEVLLWLGADGAVLGRAVGKPGEVLDIASRSLHETMEHPMWGRPHAPTRVRVASPELAAALRIGHPRLDVVCAPTPEVDRVIAAMRERMPKEASEAARSYLIPDVAPEAIGACFRAAANLYRSKPWEVVPDDTTVFSLTIDQLGMRDAVVSVIGQLGKSFGLVVFSSFEDFDLHLDAAEAIGRGEKPSIPPHFAFNFERADDLSSQLRKEVLAHGWEVAAPDAYPWLFAVDEGVVVRPPTPNELTMAEAIALALVEALRSKPALDAAWQFGKPFVQTLSVRTHAGPIEVRLRVPYETASEPRALAEVFGDLRALGDRSAQHDPVERQEVESELVEYFRASPEAMELADVEHCYVIMQLAADFFGATIATLEPGELREIIFDLAPRKLSVEASAARSILDETRALYAFLKREFALPQADECMHVLGGDAVAELEAALSRSHNYGMAKSLVMAGVEAGFDMSSNFGIERAMRALLAGSLLCDEQVSGVSNAQAKSKKQQRTPTRKARRKNR